MAAAWSNRTCCSRNARLPMRSSWCHPVDLNMSVVTYRHFFLSWFKRDEHRSQFHLADTSRAVSSGLT
jgi:hypothetical protein